MFLGCFGSKSGTIVIFYHLSAILCTSMTHLLCRTSPSQPLCAPLSTLQPINEVWPAQTERGKVPLEQCSCQLLGRQSMYFECGRYMICSLLVAKPVFVRFHCFVNHLLSYVISYQTERARLYNTKSPKIQGPFSASKPKSNPSWVLATLVASRLFFKMAIYLCWIVF